MRMDWIVLILEDSFLGCSPQHHLSGMTARNEIRTVSQLVSQLYIIYHCLIVYLAPNVGKDTYFEKHVKGYLKSPRQQNL